MKVVVIAHPNAKRPRIEEDLLGTLHVYIKAIGLLYVVNFIITKIFSDKILSCLKKKI
jgi:hypothetical protein